MYKIILIIILFISLVLTCEMVDPPASSNIPVKIYCGVPYNIKWRYFSTPPLKAYGGTLPLLNSTVLDRYISGLIPQINTSISITINCFTADLLEYFVITDISDNIICNSVQYKLTKCGNGIVDLIRSSFDLTSEECDIDYANNKIGKGCNDQCYCKPDYIGIEGRCYKTNYYVFSTDIVINKNIDLKGSNINVNGNITLNNGATINNNTIMVADCINGKINYDANNTITSIFNQITYNCSFQPNINVINIGKCLKYQKSTINNNKDITMVLKFTTTNTNLSKKLKDCSGATNSDYINCGCKSLYITIASIVISIVIAIIIIIVILASIGCSTVKKKIFPWRRDRNYDSN